MKCKQKKLRTSGQIEIINRRILHIFKKHILINKSDRECIFSISTPDQILSLYVLLYLFKTLSFKIIGCK